MPHDRPARECRPRTFARKDTHLFLFRLPLRAKMRKKVARLSIVDEVHDFVDVLVGDVFFAKAGVNSER